MDTFQFPPPPKSDEARGRMFDAIAEFFHAITLASYELKAIAVAQAQAAQQPKPAVDPRES